MRSVRHVFNLRSEERRRPLPPRILLVQRETETLTHILLKLFGYLLFFRARLRVEPNLDPDDMPFVPDLLELDLQGRMVLWIECGECQVQKLDRLAVKAPEAELWAVKRSPAAAADLARAMVREDLRRGRYGIVGLDPAMLDEVAGLLRPRNDVTWYHGDFEPPRLQFDFNGLWFESEFVVLRH